MPTENRQARYSSCCCLAMEFLHLIFFGKGIEWRKTSSQPRFEISGGHS